LAMSIANPFSLERRRIRAWVGPGVARTIPRSSGEEQPKIRKKARDGRAAALTRLRTLLPLGLREMRGRGLHSTRRASAKPQAGGRFNLRVACSTRLRLRARA